MTLPTLTLTTVTVSVVGMSPTAVATPPTASGLPVLNEKARRLVTASERQSFDPFTDVDWSVPLDLAHRVPGGGAVEGQELGRQVVRCLLYTSPSPRD